MATLVRVILSARAAWAVANEADVEENVWATSMMVRKSWVEIVIYYRCGAEVLGPTTSLGMVLGAESPGETEDSGASGTGAMVAGAGGRDAGTEGDGA